MSSPPRRWQLVSRVPRNVGMGLGCHDRLECHSPSGHQGPSHIVMARATCPGALGNAAEVTMRRGSGSGVFESSTRLTLGPRVASSGWVVGDVHRRSIADEGKEFRRRLPVQTDATVGARIGMDKALVKAVGRGELAPVSHRISDVATRDICARIGRHDAVSLHPEAVGAGALVFDLVVDREMAFRRGFVRQTDRNGRPPSGSDRLP